MQLNRQCLELVVQSQVATSFLGLCMGTEGPHDLVRCERVTTYLHLVIIACSVVPEFVGKFMIV